MRCWMASSMQWTWTWTNSRRWWGTGRRGVLQSMGLQRVEYDWVTELNWTEVGPMPNFYSIPSHKLFTSHCWCPLSIMNRVSKPTEIDNFLSVLQRSCLAAVKSILIWSWTHLLAPYCYCFDPGAFSPRSLCNKHSNNNNTTNWLQCVFQFQAIFGEQNINK